jgi:uncharacterized Ntn-hydrolase superfamily protein
VTFSIVARDRASGDLGIAVASKFLGVGAVVPWARAGIGAIATQSFANTRYGPRGLELLEGGLDAQQAMAHLLAEDVEAEVPMRQVGIVDGGGHPATFSGPQCHVWAGGRTGAGFACQGNILAGPGVVDAMADGFERSTAGELAERLLDALAAGQAAGGDRRGRQSAALLVVRDHAGYGGRNDRYIDARVDDHRQPIDELRRLLQLWRVYFQTPNPSEMLELTPDVIGEVQTLLRRAGNLNGQPSGEWDAATAKALRTWAGVENLEERLRDGGIDPIVLRLLRERHQQ